MSRKIEKTGRISLEGMRFHAFHGVLQVEKQNGNEFLVDVSFDLDFWKAGLSDKLEDTVDYSAVYQIVAEEMAKPSDLLEHVALRILQAIQSGISGIGTLDVKISKLNPPLEGKMQAVSLSIREA